MTTYENESPAGGPWVVDTDYAVLPVQDFDAKYSHYPVGGVMQPSPGLAAALRAGRAHFDTKAQARVHALKLMDLNIADAEAKLDVLRARRQELVDV